MPSPNWNDLEILQRHRDGQSYAEIAVDFGVSESSIQRHVSRFMKRYMPEKVEEIRQAEAQRLDWLWHNAAMVLQTFHYVLHDGEIVMGPPDEHGERQPMRDDTPVLRAIGVCLMIQQRRAKLFGLDAPTKVDFGGNPDPKERITFAVAEVKDLVARRKQVEGKSEVADNTA